MRICKKIGARYCVLTTKHPIIDIVSKNGNLLLNIGPKANGEIPELQIERLRTLGHRLEINGEGIFDTHPWKRAEGKTSSNIKVRFTQKNSILYAFTLGIPKNNLIQILDLQLPTNTQISILGQKETLLWKQHSKYIEIELIPPDNLEYAVRFKFNPKA